MPEILGVAEVARLLGVSRATVSSYLSRGQMPEPWVRLAAGPVWRAETIAEWRPETLLGDYPVTKILQDDTAGF